jgi:hypothetical protein
MVIRDARVRDGSGKPAMKCNEMRTCSEQPDLFALRSWCEAKQRGLAPKEVKSKSSNLKIRTTLSRGIHL